MRQEASMKCCMLVQQPDRANFYGWTEAEYQTLENVKNNKDIKPLLEVLKDKLDIAGIELEELHGIIHDKDMQKIWDDANSKYDQAPKALHFHILFKFGDSGKPLLKHVASALGVKAQYIEKAKKGKYAYDNMLSYLIHIKYTEKHQYDFHEVVTLLGTDYGETYSIRKEAWERGRASVKRKAALENIEELEELILRGLVSRNQILLTDEYYETYSRFSRRCEDAFRVYGERKAALGLQALKNGDFKLTVFFITGKAGAGKTRIAHMLIDRLMETAENEFGERWEVCSSAASNSLDEYNGEEILLMDDLRGAAMTASDWLKLLDPYHSTPASARYKNKTPICRAIIITSTVEPLEFFRYCKANSFGESSSSGESMDQFIRRIQCLTQVINADDFNKAEVIISQVMRYAQPIRSLRYGDLNYGFQAVSNCNVFDGVEKMVEYVVNNNIKTQSVAQIPAASTGLDPSEN